MTVSHYTDTTVAAHDLSSRKLITTTDEMPEERKKETTGIFPHLRPSISPSTAVYKTYSLEFEIGTPFLFIWRIMKHVHSWY